MVYSSSPLAMLPYLTPSIEPIDATFRATPDDFIVEEIPAYPPEGAGDHVFALIEKRNLTTPAAVRALCESAGADPDQAGWAGLKDRIAVSRQWVSLFGATPEALLQTSVEGVVVLEAHRHPHKLRTGHLKGNRFRLRLTHVDPARIPDARRVLKSIETHGLPNFYGEQRFGRDGDNASRALAWVTGDARPPRSRFHRKLDISALQAELFNRCLAARMQTSTLGQVFEGDVVKKHATGGEFIVDDVDEASRRAREWEISPTGPIFGPKMRWPSGEPRGHEEALLEAVGLTPAHLARWKRIAPGARRFLRVPVEKVGLDVRDRTLALDFTLPAGSYATILVREIVKRDASPPKTG